MESIPDWIVAGTALLTMLGTAASWMRANKSKRAQRAAENAAENAKRALAAAERSADLAEKQALHARMQAEHIEKLVETLQPPTLTPAWYGRNIPLMRNTGRRELTIKEVQPGDCLLEDLTGKTLAPNEAILIRTNGSYMPTEFFIKTTLGEFVLPIDYTTRP